MFSLPMMYAPLAHTACDAERRERHDDVNHQIVAILEGERDWISAMATVSCELHHAFAWYHWTGFYRAVSSTMLRIGPYQGGHGCLSIDFGRGVCGAAARTQQTQRVADVQAFPGHIACSATTQSELVVPIVTPSGKLLAVLDIDSDLPDAFSDVDQQAIEALAELLGARNWL
jgi:GAF domain-containing protein